MKRIAILGSTGSIGTSTLHVAQHLQDEIDVVALAAKSNIDALEQQIAQFKPKLVAVYDSDKAQELQQRVPNVEVVAGLEGLEAVASHGEANFVVSAIAGTLGLAPTLAAINAGKDVGLANKEALVSGGALVTQLAKAKKTKIIPIDSEHSALFQCLNGENPRSIRRLILTASGGPFRTYTDEQLRAVDVEKALKHPNWVMGPKVTIDSSTLMNKGLEVIEAHWLFDMPFDQIEVVIHPQSIIHSMVEYEDHSILAQMGDPNMIVPIQYALTYPERRSGSLQPFDFTKGHTLEFFQPDTQRFKCLQLAFDALHAGGSLPCYMNAANEVLVQRFIGKEISWLEIGTKLEGLMARHNALKINAIEDVYGVDSEARAHALHV